ncbi:MAG: hypothetical protein ACREUT_15515 [Steroidobacteraceae bacterium]
MLNKNLAWQPAPLPVVHALLHALPGRVESEELREENIAASGSNESSGFGRVHDWDLNASFKEKSNETCNTHLNGLFRIGGMGEEVNPAERPIDRALRWAKGLDMGESAFAKELGVSPQRVTNWKRRGMPATFHAKAAKVTRHTIQELLGESSPTASPTSESPWPFAIERGRFNLLDDRQKHILELIIERFVLQAELRALGVDTQKIEGQFAGQLRRRKSRVA